MRSRKLRLNLTISYDVADNILGFSDDNLLKAHREVFESDPGGFVEYLFSKKESEIEYDLSSLEEHFECDDYYYTKSLINKLCLKYGCLCCNPLCKE